MRKDHVKRITTAVLAGLCAAAFAAPAQAGEKDKKAPKEIVFPGPPDPPRIRWVRNIRSMRDLKGKGKGGAGKVLEFLAGGDMDAALVARPYGIWVAGETVYLTDTEGQRVARMGLGDAKVNFLGEGGEGGLISPVCVTADSGGNVYVTDTGDHAVKAYDSSGKFLWKRDSLAEGARLKKPSGLSWTREGDLLVLDSGNGRVVVLGKDGAFKRDFVRNMKDPFALPNPGNLWVEPNGGFIVSDPLAGRVHIFTSTGGFVSGFGEVGDGPGYMARPRGVASDSDGNVYVVDALFNRIQIFDRSGQLLLYFGSPGDKEGQLALPAGIFIDPLDRVFVVDSKNRRIAVFQYLKTSPGASSGSAPDSQEPPHPKSH